MHPIPDWTPGAVRALELAARSTPVEGELTPELLLAAAIDAAGLRRDLRRLVEALPALTVHSDRSPDRVPRSAQVVAVVDDLSPGGHRRFHIGADAHAIGVESLLYALAVHREPDVPFTGGSRPPMVGGIRTRDLDLIRDVVAHRVETEGRRLLNGVWKWRQTTGGFTGAGRFEPPDGAGVVEFRSNGTAVLGEDERNEVTYDLTLKQPDPAGIGPYRLILTVPGTGITGILTIERGGGFTVRFPLHDGYTHCYRWLWGISGDDGAFTV